MSPVLVQIILAIFKAVEPVAKSALIALLKSLDASATSAIEKQFIEEFLKVIGG